MVPFNTHMACPSTSFRCGCHLLSEAPQRLLLHGRPPSPPGHPQPAVLTGLACIPLPHHCEHATSSPTLHVDLALAHRTTCHMLNEKCTETVRDDSFLISFTAHLKQSQEGVHTHIYLHTGAIGTWSPAPPCVQMTPSPGAWIMLGIPSDIQSSVCIFQLQLGLLAPRATGSLSG